MELITKRPNNIKFSEYQILRKEQSKQIKSRVKNGFLFYKSWEFPQNGFTQEANYIAGNIIKYEPYVRKSNINK